MEIHYLNATFGRLEQQELRLYPGLNLICAPNESGKSTWSAFIRTMLYGLSTRDRGPLADKNRYAPWSGAAMQGRMDLLADGRACTLLRNTRRANAPMGGFSCAYTGTATPVEGLTALNAGEQLLGPPGGGGPGLPGQTDDLLHTQDLLFRVIFVFGWERNILFTKD